MVSFPSKSIPISLNVDPNGVWLNCERVSECHSQPSKKLFWNLIWKLLRLKLIFFSDFVQKNWSSNSVLKKWILLKKIFFLEASTNPTKLVLPQQKCRKITARLRLIHITAFSTFVCGRQLHFHREIGMFLSLSWNSLLQKMQTDPANVNQPLRYMMCGAKWVYTNKYASKSSHVFMAFVLCQNGLYRIAPSGQSIKPLQS